MSTPLARTGLAIVVATPILSFLTQYKSWPEMEGRKGPFMGYVAKPPPLTEKQVKELKLKEMKEQVAALEKELYAPAPPPSASKPGEGFFDWVE